jgi:NADH dehydrogenase
MRVVVTGGTGLIGRHIVEHLLAAGITDVAVTSRDPQQHESSPVPVVQAFAGDPLSLGAAFAGADVVVHAIQFPNHPVEKPSLGRTYLQVDGHGTVAAVAAARAARVGRFIYLSGAGAGEGRPQPWFQAKDMAEKAIRESGLEYAILRPSWVYGPGDRSMSRFIAFCRYLPFFPQIGDGRTAVYPIAVDDVAQAVMECVRREDAKDTVLSLAGPQRLTMDEIVRIVQKALGTWRPIVHHPVGLMKLLARPMALLPKPLLSPSAVDFVTQSVDMDPKPAMDYLGFSFRTLEDGLRVYLR